MSGTVITIWENKEEVENWFKGIINQREEIIVPEIKDEGFDPYRQDIERGIWVIFGNNGQYDFDVGLDYAIWDSIGRAYSTIIIQELSRKFKIKEAGWDSVGFCTDDFFKSEGLLVRVYRNKPDFEKQVLWLEKVNKILREEAKKLVNL